MNQQQIEQATGISTFQQASKAMPLFRTTRFLQLKNIISFELSNRFDTCRLVHYDILQKCENFGTVVQIKIPRPIWVGAEGRIAPPVLIEHKTKRGKKSVKLEPIDDPTYF